jgi:hypothetical protein
LAGSLGLTAEPVRKGSVELPGLFKFLFFRFLGYVQGNTHILDKALYKKTGFKVVFEIPGN